MTTALQMSLFAPPPKAFVPKGHERFIEPYEDPFLRYHADTLAAAGEDRIVFDEDNWDRKSSGAVGCDVESFVNFFVICFKRFADGKRLAFELSTRNSVLDKSAIAEILNNNTIITFNGQSYDLPIIYAALSGVDPVTLKRLTEQLISGGMKPWEVEKKLGIRVPRKTVGIQHIDLMEPNPAVKQGLKIIHGRLHGRFMIDIPYDIDATLTPQQMNVTTLYCHNDIDATQELYVAMREPLELRAALGRIYGMDLRSKSDAQLGEAIVKRRVETQLGRKIDRVEEIRTPDFKYVAPTFIRFDSLNLANVLAKIQDVNFAISSSGHPIAPSWLENLEVKIGAATYAMGIGGLHSTETHRAVSSDADNFLMDVDVASQYPNIIMNLSLYPPRLGPAFLEVYGQIIQERLDAKKKMLDLEKDVSKKKEYTYWKVRADGGRIMSNGVYGKLGSRYSVLYAPNHVITITLTGQLAILMLIEQSENAGIPVVSANTDGVVFRCPRRATPLLDSILQKWENDTGFTIERTFYKALYNSSVNTYIAIREDGKVKRKGYIAAPWAEGDKRGQIMKNPQMTICSEAILRYLTAGVPFQDTIGACQDPRSFVTVIKVTGGAKWRGVNLGRAVRYYWSTGGEPITYASSSKRVSKTEGARPLVELTDELPRDIDYLRYYQETIDLATDLGIVL